MTTRTLGDGIVVWSCACHDPKGPHRKSPDIGEARGFPYRGLDGTPVGDREFLDFIAALAVESSDEITTYIRDAAHGRFTAKDFRTWSGTVMGAAALATTGPWEDGCLPSGAIGNIDDRRPHAVQHRRAYGFASGKGPEGRFDRGGARSGRHQELGNFVVVDDQNTSSIENGTGFTFAAESLPERSERIPRGTA